MRVRETRRKRTGGTKTGKRTIHCQDAILWLEKQGVKSVTNPFVGSGTVVAIANAFGMKAVGVDIDKAQCEKARKLVLEVA